MCHDIPVSSREREKFKTAQTKSRHRIEVATSKEDTSEVARSLSEKLMLRQKYKLKTPVRSRHGSHVVTLK